MCTLCHNSQAMKSISCLRTWCYSHAVQAYKYKLVLKCYNLFRDHATDILQCCDRNDIRALAQLVTNCLAACQVCACPWLLRPGIRSALGARVLVVLHGQLKGSRGPGLKSTHDPYAQSLSSLTYALQPSSRGWPSCCVPPAGRPLCHTRAASLGKHGRLSGIISALLTSTKLIDLHAFLVHNAMNWLHP